MSTDRELPPCPLCRAPCVVDTSWGGWMQWMCSGKQHNGVGCVSANSEGAWLELCEGPQLPTCKANKSRHALHLVAERWERLDENVACGMHSYQHVAQVARLMADTCRAIASTTCELYAPGPAGSDRYTTCSGRGLPECATCSALEPTDPPLSVWVPDGPESPAAEIARNPDLVVDVHVKEPKP